MLVRALLILGVMVLCTFHAHAQSGFPDVSSADPYAEAVEMLREHGIFTGYPDGMFHGSRPVTRYELAVVVSRMMTYYEQALPAGSRLQPQTDERESSTAVKTGAQAVSFLVSRHVHVPETVLSAGGSPSTQDEVVELLSSAFSRLVEMATPPGKEQDIARIPASDSCKEEVTVNNTRSAQQEPTSPPVQ